MADIITGIRIVCSIALLFCPPLSPAFYALYITAGVREMVALHTVMNKITGILLFILPLTLNSVDLRYSGVIVATAATFAAIQERYLIRKGTEDNSTGMRSASA